MRLSILMPSHRDDPAAISRIAQACSWARPDVEVVVRDNSGKPAKRDAVERFAGENRRIVFAAECDATANFLESLALARGDFVFFVGDDDLCFDRGIAAVADAARRFADDASVAGIAGAYALEEHRGSSIVGYPDLESPDAVKRVFGYLGYQGPNLLFYSPLRRQVAVRSWQFLRDHPFGFPFHDQVLSLVYLLSGRFVDIRRLMIVYDNMHWESVDKAAASDTGIYSAANMDPAFGLLHWLLCGFEGARLALNSPYGLRCSPAERQRVANRWFEVMFARFAGDRRSSHGSRLGPQAEALCQEWRRRHPYFDLDRLLDDVCGFMALFSPEKARSYRDFWQSLKAEAERAQAARSGAG